MLNTGSPRHPPVLPGAPSLPLTHKPRAVRVLWGSEQGVGCTCWRCLCQVSASRADSGETSGKLLRSGAAALLGAHGRALLCRRALGVSVTDYTFEDCQLALAEGQLRLPADTCLLEFARLVRGLG